MNFLDLVQWYKEFIENFNKFQEKQRILKFMTKTPNVSAICMFFFCGFSIKFP